jgi:hypothetical protein
MGVRAINMALGPWPFFSTYLWPHTKGQRVTGWAIGMLAVAAALAGTCRRTWGRLLKAALGVWLIVSALLVPRLRVAAFWTDVVGLALVLFAILPGCLTPWGTAGSTAKHLPFEESLGACFGTVCLAAEGTLNVQSAGDANWLPTTRGNPYMKSGDLRTRPVLRSSYGSGAHARPRCQRLEVHGHECRGTGRFRRSR